MTEPEADIVVRSAPEPDELKRLGVFLWDVWTKEKSVFPWTYDCTETCYFLEGDVIVTPDGGEPVRVGKGDLVVFAAGLSCTWDVREGVRKHFTFGVSGAT